MNVIWSPQAQRDMELIYDYIAKDSYHHAFKMVKRISRYVMKLSQFPHMGRPGRMANTRELVIPESPYIIAYFCRDECVYIAGVIHGLMKWPEKFNESD